MTTGEETDFKGMCIELRKKLKENAEHLKTQIQVAKDTVEVTSDQDKGEKIANLMLAYRHLEDSAMRIGKAIQAHEGGISVYDQNMPERDLNKEA